MIPAEISAAATDLASDGWVKVGRVQDLPVLEGRRTTIEGRRVAVFRLLDGLAAIDATCPHKAGPLQDGLVADNCVTCPLHDRRIDLSTGQMIGYDDAVAVHEVHQHGDEVWVRLSQVPQTPTEAERAGLQAPAAV
ncbi:MAG: nitrite reductase (NAD(P)H) small subunit [Solirubrobacteraceae bacterium]|nr:nitrite reductase (NAD(P)H) small subunit [Solirubrobacteraceae bacterium]